MNNIVNIKELRLNMNKYVNAVARGKSFLVMKRSRPVFQMNPIKEISLADDGPGWKTVIDFTKIRKGGVPLEEAMEVLRKVREEEDDKTRKGVSKTKRVRTIHR